MYRCHYHIITPIPSPPPSSQIIATITTIQNSWFTLIPEPEAKILMDAQEKEMDNYGKNDKNWGYNVDENVVEDINIEGLRIQDSTEADNV